MNNSITWKDQLCAQEIDPQPFDLLTVSPEIITYLRADPEGIALLETNSVKQIKTGLMLKFSICPEHVNHFMRITCTHGRGNTELNKDLYKSLLKVKRLLWPNDDAELFKIWRCEDREQVLSDLGFNSRAYRALLAALTPSGHKVRGATSMDVLVKCRARLDQIDLGWVSELPIL